MKQHSLKPDFARTVMGGIWFSGLPLHARQKILNGLQVTEHRKSDILFRQGSDFTGLFCVLRGTAHLSGVSKIGDETLMSILRPGEWSGFLAALQDTCYAFEASMADDGYVGKLPAILVREIFEQDVETYKMLVAPQLAAIRKLYVRFVNMQKPTPLRRVADQLMAFAQWHFADASFQAAPISSVSQAQIAASVNLSRQTVNQIFQQIESAGIIEQSLDGIRIIDIDALQNLAHHGLSES